MPVQVALNTPLADALSASVRPKLVEVGWGSGGAEDAALAEYIILMLINGKTEKEIAADITNELLNLGPDDRVAYEFAEWLFREIEVLDAHLNGTAAPVESQQADSLSSGVEDKDSAMDVTGDASDLNVPTGPRSMRTGNGSGARGGREKRMMGHLNKAMDRTHDPLHRIRGQTGNERINSHSRGPPSGPRGAHVGRQPRNMNGRAASLQAGLNAMGQQMNGMPGMVPNGVEGWNMDPQQSHLMAILQHQTQVMQQMSQQLMATGGAGAGANGGFQGHRGRGRGGRGDHRGGGFGRNQHHQQNNQQNSQQPAPKNGTSEQGVDTEMDASKTEASNPEDTICKYNLRCTNKDCKFAHQSPAAPPGITVDLQDVCSFGAACKNFKCTARHPSPAARLAHQSDQECRFFPNCQNPRCTFKHPNMPLCRNGASCTTPNCKFTHVKTKCKYTPCLNPQCPFVHDVGQQGGFKDKVWTAESEKDHVSERKFVDDNAETEMVIPEGGDEDAHIS